MFSYQIKKERPKNLSKFSLIVINQKIYKKQILFFYNPNEIFFKANLFKPFF